MSLPILIKACALAVAGWILLRLCGRVARLEAVTGAWRVQGEPPWADEAWWASDAFDRELARWTREQRDEAA